MNTDTSHTATFSSERAAKLLEEAEAFAARQRQQHQDKPTFADTMQQFKAALADLPESVEIPPHLTPEGQRMAEFRRVMQDSPEFMQAIDRARLPNPAAFDYVAKWAGTFRGPLAYGVTNTAKTRAAWSALGRLYVRENMPFAWFPGRRLVNELAKYEERNAADEFFRTYDFFKLLFVDDVDKINWQFDSQKAALFAFYDWIYRHRKPCITTTNKDRQWWADRMGDAFARRMFDDAHNAVAF